ncbi:MAG: hypothetical protein R6U91_04995 [Bacillota bacterium]
MLTQRMKVSLVTGAILGVVCIVGVSIRSGFDLNAFYLFAFWYNRLLMGFVIGLLDGKLGLPKVLYRGMGIGLLVSFAFYSSTGFGDPVGFIAGIIYGVIIEYVAFKYGEVR